MLQWHKFQHILCQNGPNSCIFQRMYYLFFFQVYPTCIMQYGYLYMVYKIHFEIDSLLSHYILLKTVCFNCGGLNKYSPYRSMYLNVWFPVKRLFRKDQELWPSWRMYVTIGWALRFQKPVPGPGSFSFCTLPVDKDGNSQLLLQDHACLPAAMLTTMMIMDSTSETVKQDFN